MQKKIELAQQETNQIIDELLEDGSDPDALYIIEHHIASHDFNQLEKMAIEAFKLGFEVTDPEELEDHSIICDIISETPLDAELINAQIAQLLPLCEQFNLHYEGWGTYFEDGEDDEFENEYEINEEEREEIPTKH